MDTGARSVRSGFSYGLGHSASEWAQDLVEIHASGVPASVAMREQDVEYQAALPLDVRSSPPEDPNRYYGQVVHTAGLVVDQPLSAVRLSYGDRPTAASYTQRARFGVIPLWDRQGTAKLGVFRDGAWAKPLTGGGTACQAGASAQRCVQLVWAEASSAYDLLRGWAPQSDMGAVLEQQRNASGTYDRRARVYDPATGRFTQEDPIGLAGGLNLYGYANGDPVNFRDPFGLCPIEVDGVPRTFTKGVKGLAAGSAIGALTVGAVGTLVLPGAGTVSGTAGGFLVGGALGSAGGAALGAADDLAFLFGAHPGMEWVR